MYERTLLKNIDRILESESEEDIKEYTKELRENILTSARLLRASVVFWFLILFSHYLLSIGNSAHVTIMGAKIPNSSIGRNVLLLAGAVTFSTSAFNEYMWRLYRETYDWIAVKKMSEFTKTGLHDFRLPAGIFMAPDLLRDSGSNMDRYVSLIIRYIFSFIFIGIPMSYLLMQSISNISNGLRDYSFATVVLNSVVILLVLLAGYVTYKSYRIQALSVQPPTEKHAEGDNAAPLPPSP